MLFFSHSLYLNHKKTTYMQATFNRILAIFIFSLTSLVSYSQHWEKIGKDGEWGTTSDVIAMNGYLYSIELGIFIYLLL